VRLIYQYSNKNALKSFHCVRNETFFSFCTHQVFLLPSTGGESERSSWLSKVWNTHPSESNERLTQSRKFTTSGTENNTLCSFYYQPKWSPIKTSPTLNKSSFKRLAKEDCHFSLVTHSVFMAVGYSHSKLELNSYFLEGS
jgi:hypothetical protein